MQYKIVKKPYLKFDGTGHVPDFHDFENACKAQLASHQPIGSPFIIEKLLCQAFMSRVVMDMVGMPGEVIEESGHIDECGMLQMAFDSAFDGTVRFETVEAPKKRGRRKKVGA